MDIENFQLDYGNYIKDEIANDLFQVYSQSFLNTVTYPDAILDERKMSFTLVFEDRLTYTPLAIV